MAKKGNEKGRARRHRRVRAKIAGTAARPRLAVFRSARHISAQLIDDTAQKTVHAVSDRDVKSAKAAGAVTQSVAIAFAVGETLGKRAHESGIRAIVFDRGGFAYHGRVKALADGARKAGLKF